ncbi:hypothetical protein [Thermogutta sp.]|uniref:hypothetical protein n=1 Tax=Thermogutta sp. TaxID=1962930 RepID=UPI00321FA0FE
MWIVSAMIVWIACCFPSWWSVPIATIAGGGILYLAPPPGPIVAGGWYKILALVPVAAYNMYLDVRYQVVDIRLDCILALLCLFHDLLYTQTVARTLMIWAPIGVMMALGIRWGKVGEGDIFVATSTVFASAPHHTMFLFLLVLLSALWSLWFLVCRKQKQTNIPYSPLWYLAAIGGCLSMTAY